MKDATRTLLCAVAVGTLSMALPLMILTRPSMHPSLQQCMLPEQQPAHNTILPPLKHPLHQRPRPKKQRQRAKHTCFLLPLNDNGCLRLPAEIATATQPHMMLLNSRKLNTLILAVVLLQCVHGTLQKVPLPQCSACTALRRERSRKRSPESKHSLN
jgi:hypothetical protein